VKGYHKSQGVRLLDVFVIAPFLFYIGATVKMKRIEKAGVYGVAAGTLFYNGINYLKNKRLGELEK